MNGTPEYVAGYTPGLIGRITELHGVFYGREWGADVGFEVLMARGLCAFCDSYDPARELLLTRGAPIDTRPP